MKRKIIKQANQAYTITLPIEWVRENKLNEKSEIDIEIKEKTLVINTKNPILGEKTKLDVTGLTVRKIYRNLNALYARGVDEIELSSEEEIPSFSLNALMGFAIVEQKPTKILIKDISGMNYSNIDEIFKRVFQMILSFYDSALQDIFQDEKETIQGLKDRDLEVNKFCFYLQRAINKMLYSNHINGRVLFTYSFELEKISDEIERLWKTNLTCKLKKSAELRKLAELSKESLEKSFDLYFIFNKKTIDEIYFTREKIREKTLSFKTNSAESKFIRHLSRISEDAADLIHLTLMIKL
jgi:phosphate uptake regulator